MLKLFEAFRKEGLVEALSSVFKTTPGALEAAWLKQVRNYTLSESMTGTSAQDVPVLERALLVVPAGDHGEGKAQLRLFITDGSGNLSPENVFITDESTGEVFQTRASGDREEYFWAELASPLVLGATKYTLRITAVDNSGNVRIWKRVCGGQLGTCTNP